MTESKATDANVSTNSAGNTPPAAAQPTSKGAARARIRPEGLTRGQWRKRKLIKRIEGYWPELFNTDNPKPLNRDIVQDMIKDIKARGIALGERGVKVALNAYTRHGKYIKCVAAGGYRYNLNGKRCGRVTEQAAARAQERLNALKAARKSTTSANNSSTNASTGTDSKQDERTATHGR
ncbi:hypothetical protein DPO11_26270 [Salmonella enterica]|nr:hypothetical protein [Salmonella enterica]